METRYTFTEAMNEISGFGGEFERQCRAAVCAGARWCAEHPHAEPEFGVAPYESERILPLNLYAASLLKSIETATMKRDDGTQMYLIDVLTPTMLTMILHHVMFINRLGWDCYVRKMTAPVHIIEEGEDA